MQLLTVVLGGEALTDGLTDHLRGAGSQIERLSQPADIGRVFRAAFDMLLVDSHLPLDAGIEWVRALRRERLTAPILVLSADGREADCARWIHAGADDCLVKPVDPLELADRLQALAGRSSRRKSMTLQHGSVELHLPSRTALRSGERVNLTPREWRLVEALATRCDRIVPRAELERLVHGPDGELASNALEVHLWSVRRKLGRGVIRTVRGMGYLLQTK